MKIDKIKKEFWFIIAYLMLPLNALYCYFFVKLYGEYSFTLKGAWLFVLTHTESRLANESLEQFNIRLETKLDNEHDF